MHKFYFACLLPELVEPRNVKPAFIVLSDQVYNEKFIDL